MSLRDLVMSVGFSGSKAEKGLKNVDKAADKAKKSMEDLGSQTKNTGKVVDGLGKDTSVARRGLDTLGRGLDTAKRKTKELGAEAKKVGKQMQTDFKEAMENAAPKNMFEGARRVGATAMAGGAAGAAVIGLGANAAISYETAFAGVRKTVDATEEEYAALSQEIRGLAKTIPATAVEIAGVTEAAGQLGISKEGLMEFTRTMVDLGVATNMSSDEAATSLARFANITQMSEDDYSRLGSTVVALGNSLATTESEIVGMTMRLAGAGTQVGMTESDILAFAGALSSVGIAAEAGGSAFSKVMIDMASEVATNGENLGRFAKVAGMSAAEFKEAYQKDASGAIISFTEGLGKMSAEGQDVFGVLDELGFSEIRVRDALLRASGAGDLFRDSLEIGSGAWAENLALSKEAAERYKTTAAKLIILKNTLKDIGFTFGDMLLPYINSFADSIGVLAGKFDNLSPGIKKFGAIAFVAGTALLLIAGPILLLVGILPSIAAGFSMLGTISLGVLGPIALAILGIAAAGVLLYKNWDKIKAFGLTLWNSFKAQIEPFVPYIQNVFNAVKAILQVGFSAIKGIVQIAFVPIKALFVTAWEFIKSTIITAVEVIGGVLGGLMQTFSGIIDFVVGVFTADWGRAWQGVQDIFGGIFNGIVAIGKGVINNLIGVINSFIGGLNSIKAPDWVPLVGGKSANISLIPRLAKGTDFFEGGLAMVGEKGPELVHLPRGTQVTPHQESVRSITTQTTRNYGAVDNYLAPQVTLNIDARGSAPGVGQEIEKVIDQRVKPMLDAFWRKQWQQLAVARPQLTER